MYMQGNCLRNWRSPFSCASEEKFDCYHGSVNWWDEWIDWECFWRSSQCWKWVLQGCCIYTCYIRTMQAQHQCDTPAVGAVQTRVINSRWLPSYLTFSSWPQQLGAEDSAGCCWRAGRRRSSRWQRVGADGAAQRQHHGDGLPIAGALQRWSSHTRLHRCIYCSHFTAGSYSEFFFLKSFKNSLICSLLQCFLIQIYIDVFWLKVWCI